MSFRPFRQKLAKPLRKSTKKKLKQPVPSTSTPVNLGNARITFGSANLCENDRRVAVVQIILQRDYMLENFFNVLALAPKKCKSSKQKAAAVGFFKQAKQLIGTVRELTVNLMDAVKAWRRVYVKPQPFMHEGKNYLTNAMHSLYPAARFPAFIDFLGFSLAENPMAIPPHRPEGEDRLLDWETYLKTHSFLLSEQQTFGRAPPPPMFQRVDKDPNQTNAKNLERKEKLRRAALREYRTKVMAKVLKKHEMVGKKLQATKEAREKAEQRHAEKRNKEMEQLASEAAAKKAASLEVEKASRASAKKRQEKRDRQDKKRRLQNERRINEIKKMQEEAEATRIANKNKLMEQLRKAKAEDRRVAELQARQKEKRRLAMKDFAERARHDRCVAALLLGVQMTYAIR